MKPESALKWLAQTAADVISDMKPASAEANSVLAQMCVESIEKRLQVADALEAEKQQASDADSD